MSHDVFLSRVGKHAHHKPIRIVPLFVPAPAKPAASPAQFTYNGGPLLTSVQVFTVFWGSAWQQSPASDLISQLNGFFDYILTSSLIDQLAEYDTSQYQIGHGTRTGTLTLTTSEPGTSVADSDIQQMLSNAISSSAIPQPGANSLYFVYLPEGVTVTMDGSSSCQSFCGYHNDGNNGQFYYAVEPYPGCSGCLNNFSAFDALTITSSHELCESITDPVPGEGWYDQNNGEIGDICAWQTKQLGSFTIQKEWSNNSNSCV